MNPSPADRAHYARRTEVVQRGRRAIGRRAIGRRAIGASLRRFGVWVRKQAHSTGLGFIPSPFPAAAAFSAPPRGGNVPTEHPYEGGWSVGCAANASFFIQPRYETSTAGYSLPGFHYSPSPHSRFSISGCRRGRMGGGGEALGLGRRSPPARLRPRGARARKRGGNRGGGGTRRR